MINWETVDIAELETVWQASLDACHQDTVYSLEQAAVDSRALLPLLEKCGQSILVLSEQYQEYCGQLEAMGRAVQAIQEINKGLLIQSNNQKALLDVLDELLRNDVVYDANIDALIKTIDSPNRVGEIAAALTELTAKLAPPDPDLAGMLVVRERRSGIEESCSRASLAISNYVCNVFSTFAKPNKKMSVGISDEQVSFMRIYTPIFTALKSMDIKRYSECIATLHIHLNTHVSVSLKSLIDTIKKQYLIGDSQRYLFTTMAAPSSSASTSAPYSILSLTGDFLPPDVPVKSSIPEERPNVNYNSFKLLDLANGLPHLETKSRLNVYQAAHYIILHLAHGLDAIYYLLEQAFSPDTAKKMASSLSSMIVEQILQLLKYDSDSIQCLAAIEERLAEPSAINLELLRGHLKRQVDTFASAQIQAIKEFKVSVKRRSGIFPITQTLPLFLSHMSSFSLLPQPHLGEQIVRMKRNVAQACIKQVDHIIPPLQSKLDEKEQVNATVMAVENTWHLLTNKANLEPEEENMAKACYEKAVNAYIALHCPKIFGDKLFAFLTNLEAECKTTSPKDILFKPEYSKTIIRRLVSSPSLKEAQGGVEYVKQRIFKHFEPQTLGNVVWKAVAEEITRRMVAWKTLLARIYDGLSCPSLELPALV